MYKELRLLFVANNFSNSNYLVLLLFIQKCSLKSPGWFKLFSRETPAQYCPNFRIILDLAASYERFIFSEYSAKNFFG